ncbi:hypothetical protein EJB05_16471 [Eragrostis curvula]|uniref:GRF-type domain-containing protein n=2 Tax=Eragrostis curvula TaxID=38414 RepID=A0A5J9VI22_9POAL|nr:hypothetical protein EJB05_16471 [Eragrostis curvula]
MTYPRDKYGCRIRVQYPRVSSVDGPVPPTLPVPNCECGHPAVVQQSRHRVTAARAFYECRSDECFFFQWIDGQEMYDPRILLFPWNRKSFEYKAFKRWVPPPPNPPPMTNDEKVAAARLRVRNPPLCHCEYWSELETPPVGLDYTPFFRCALVGSTGWRLCDFQEYVYGRKSHWPVNELEDLLQQYINGKEPLPCDKYPPKLCPCGVPAREGVVPSELGDGYFCGNTVGDNDAWHTRRCDWETFPGRTKLLDQIRRTVPPYDQWLLEETRNRVRSVNGIVIPPGWIISNIKHEFNTDFDGALLHWRKNKDKYPTRGDWVPLTESMREDGLLRFINWNNRLELNEWCSNKLIELADPVIQEEKRKKKEEEKRRQVEAYKEAQLRNPGSLESFFARLTENARKRREEQARAAMVASVSRLGNLDDEGTTEANAPNDREGTQVDEQEEEALGYYLPPSKYYAKCDEPPPMCWCGDPCKSPPPLCDFQQWIDTERSEEALEYISSWKRGKAREKELAARHKAEREEEERRREEERKKAKEKRDKERERRRERVRRAKEAVEAGGPDVLRKGKWPRCTQ